MKFPDVKLSQGDSIFKADERVEHEFERAGLSLVVFEGLNSYLDIGSYCHFFHVPGLVEDSGERWTGVVVVVTRPLEEKNLIHILNILLEIRMNPDPPGSRAAIQFYSPYELPRVLQSVFGSSACCGFECRALLVARFGHEIQPGACQQLAAMAANLSKEYFDLRLSFVDPAAEELIERVILEHFAPDTECAEPVNSLIGLGCLFGEALRSRSPSGSFWADSEECRPWPALILGGAGSDGETVVANPIALTMQCFQDRKPGLLVEAAGEILRRAGQPQAGKAV